MADSNPAFVYVTGPVHVFTRVMAQGASPFNPLGSNSGPVLYLGTTQLCPEFDRVKRWQPIFTALGGDAKPFDHRWGGQDVSIGLDLVRHSDTVLRGVEACPNFGRNGLDDGVESFGDRGKMMLANGASFELWLVNTFARFGNANLNAFPDLRLGYYFRACKTDRVYRPRDGLVDSMARLDVTAESVYDVRTMSFFTHSSLPAYFNNLPFPM